MTFFSFSFTHNSTILKNKIRGINIHVAIIPKDKKVRTGDDYQSRM